MRMRHIVTTGLCTTILVSLCANASAQDTQPPALNIERVPLIHIQINPKDSATVNVHAEKSPASNTTKTQRHVATPKAKQAPAAIPAKPELASKIRPSPASEHMASEGTGNVTNITTHNNSVTYNITNHVTTAGTGASAPHTPAVTVHVNPDAAPVIAPLTTPATVITPPAPVPAPASDIAESAETNAADTDMPMAETETETEIEADIAPESAIETDITPEPEPESEPALAPDANAVEEPAPKAAPVKAPVPPAKPAAATGTGTDAAAPALQHTLAPDETVVPDAGTPPAKKAVPAKASGATAPAPKPAAIQPPSATPPAAPASTTHPANVPISTAPAQKSVATSSPDIEIKPLPPTKPPVKTKPKTKPPINTSLHGPHHVGFLRVSSATVKKNIVRTQAKAGNKKPASPVAPPKKAVARAAPSPYGLWIKTPKGSGKKPTIIALHGCGGLYSTINGEKSELTPRHETMARVFTSAGYNVFLPDSFTPRGKHGNCTESLNQWQITSQQDRVDVEAAMRWLSTQDDVDMNRIALFGWSYGATTLFAALNLAYTDVAVRDIQPKAAVAFYPSCAPYLDENRPFKLAAPALVLIGENDMWTPAKACQRFGKRLEGKDHSITVKTYPNTYHDFDAPGTPIYVRLDVEAADGKPGGVTAGGNPESRAAAYKEILIFLRDHL